MAIRGAIHPALESTQKAAEEMQSAVASGTSISIRQFNELEAIVRKTGDAMNRVSQAGGMVGDLTGGKDFRTQSPQAYAALERAKAAQQSAYALPAGTITSAPALLARQRAAAMAVAAAYANVESRRDLGQDQTKALADLKRKIDRLDQVNALIEKEVSGHNAAAAAIKQATAESNALRGSLAKIADSIGEPAAPIDRAKLAIDRMNEAIKKLKDPSKKAIFSITPRTIASTPRVTYCRFCEESLILKSVTGLKCGW
jgi:chromosome segregation ATPase